MPSLKITRYLFFLLVFAACAGLNSHARFGPTSGPAKQAALSVPVGSVSDPERSLKTARDLLKNGDGRTAFLLARSVAEQYPDTVWYKRSLFLMEQALIRADRLPEAEEAMLRVRAEYPELADYAVFLLAEYHFSGSRFSKAAASYEQVVDRYPKSPLTARAAIRRGQALLGAGAGLQAAEAFEHFLHDYPQSEFASDAALGLARALVANAQFPLAVKAYRDAWARYPAALSDQDVEQVRAALRSSGAAVPEFTGDDWYERAVTLYRAGQFDKAVNAFKKALDNKPSLSPSNRADALLKSGIALFNLARRIESSVVLEKFVRDNPRGARTPEALCWLAKSYGKAGDTDRAVATFRKILDGFPDSEWADDALFFTGNIFRENGDLNKALRYYGRLAREYPDSKYADSAIWWRAWSYYTSGAYEKAGQELQTMIDRYPRSFLVNQARYWQGRAAEKLNAPSNAASYYSRIIKHGPYTYYGYRAAERLHRLEASGDAVIGQANADIITCGYTPCPDDAPDVADGDEGPPVWTEEAKKLLASDPAFRRALELMSLDMKTEAAQELSSLQNKAPHGRGAIIGLSKAFFELGDYNRSLMLVLRNYERYLDGPESGASDDLWRLAYPEGYWDSVVAYARKYGQDPYFIAAIIREESQFSVAALSPAGARGLMQIMPSTGTWAAQIIKLSGFNGGRLFDSDTAVQIGTWYIASLMKRFKGDPLLTAAAYNAGPDAVTAWVGRNGYQGERDAFVEMIPFSETRGYVKKVMRNYAEYRRIYGKTGQIVSRTPEAPQSANGR